MLYQVTVKTGSSQEKVIVTDSLITLYTRAKPHDGEANLAVIKQLAKHFHTAKSNITIVRGAKSKHKLIEIT